MGTDGRAPEGRWDPSTLAPPMRPTPLTQDGLLGLFKGETVGRDVKLEPASQEDMRGGVTIDKPSLEVVYDTV